ncbi:Glycosyltransferase 28 domain protein [Desulfatibacillum aliphaticivorans]|uniref:Glycosyltransferase 28 domain protein n=1 Tax=Desulfatibacillum aliphaticivorans TaxID=218208 RepID=B8FHJ4_DESAL|nr:glycosyltransferase [Desulfatibacillum aliphaticivorans]ACL02282.1 Glycosyltransferase 28 domain protein [Desulfatibacillum aliphaticivorans]
MKRKSTYNILMYSHDTYGLGHIRRTMAIASHLRGRNTNILILTGSPIVGRYALPDKIDFVRIPGMIKKANEEYLPLSIKIHPNQALDIRKSIIKATAKTFQPHLFIVDKEPLGLKKEILPTLQWLRRSLPGTRTVLGLRDIMDESSATCKDWRDKGIYDLLEDTYSEIWVYGIKEFYDPITEYRIPSAISDKMLFTGYIPRNVPAPAAVKAMRKRFGCSNGEKLVVATTGGGGDGYSLLNCFLSMLERQKGKTSFKSLLVTGPFMAEKERDNVVSRAKKLGVQAIQFHRSMEEVLAAADLVVSMGGYNTVCESLTLGRMSLIIPRETPRKEQLIRAQVLKERRLVDYIPEDSLCPEAMDSKIKELLGNSKTYLKAISEFQLTGLDVISQRLKQFQRQPAGCSCKKAAASISYGGLSEPSNPLPAHAQMARYHGPE